MGETTVSEWVPRAMRSMAPSTQRGWSTYARLIVSRWGDRTLDEVLTTDIEEAAHEVQRNAKRRAVSSAGTGAQEGFVSCCRAVWKRAVDNDLAKRNPASKIKLPPRRPKQGRRALTPAEIVAVQSVLALGSDPELGLIVFRVCLETGARRNELLGLTTRSLHGAAGEWVLVLDEGAKLSSKRDLPITDTLAEALMRLATSRIGEDWSESVQPLLRNRRRQPITHRWLEYQAVRIRKSDPDTLGNETTLHFTWHLLRHTAATNMEHAGGFAAAQAFLGHAPSGGSATSVTLQYTKPTLEYLRQCLEIIWEPDKAAGRYERDRRQRQLRDALVHTLDGR